MVSFCLTKNCGRWSTPPAGVADGVADVSVTRTVWRQRPTDPQLGDRAPPTVNLPGRVRLATLARLAVVGLLDRGDEFVFVHARAAGHVEALGDVVEVLLGRVRVDAALRLAL